MCRPICTDPRGDDPLRKRYNRPTSPESIRQFQHLIEILADEQHRNTPVARSADLPPYCVPRRDPGRSMDFEAPANRRFRKLSRQYRPLHVSAREIVDPRERDDARIR